MLAIPSLLSRDALRDRLLSDLPGVLLRLYPAGVRRGKDFVVGDCAGSEGESLTVALTGEKAGLWHDFATGEGGDIFDLFAAAFGLSQSLDFSDLLKRIETWLGSPLPQAASISTKVKQPLPEPSCYWIYTDKAGQPIAKVFRYDMPDGGKEFRPYDLIAKRWRAPEPRPLYNLPALTSADTIIFVEGEKCAQALIEQGYVATTAMNGANAPVDKTDWSPLIGKRVIVWPDNDSSGLNYARTITRTLTEQGAAHVVPLSPPPDKPPKWDAADAVDQGFDIDAFLSKPPAPIPTRIPAFSLNEFLVDNRPLPPDLIAPRILTPGGLLVIGGAPKVGKSDFLLSWLTHMAAGRPFLDMKPPRRLRVFYLQAEIEYAYLKERIAQLTAYEGLIEEAGAHLVATPRLRMTLNESGVRDVAEAIKSRFGSLVDIIVIDPIRNVYDLAGKGENDNSAMLHFLTERIDTLREMVNPQAGVILVHHTRKISKSQYREDPFQALSGAGSLRSYYTTGMMLFREDEQGDTRELHFELRNGSPLPVRFIHKRDGLWSDFKCQKGRSGEKANGSRDKIVLDLIASEARQGRLHTMRTFCEQFGGKKELGGYYGLEGTLNKLSENKHIQYVLELPEYGFPKTTSTLGYLVTQSLSVFHGGKLVPVTPTHIRGESKRKPEAIIGTPLWPDGKGVLR